MHNFNPSIQKVSWYYIITYKTTRSAAIPYEGNKTFFHNVPYSTVDVHKYKMFHPSPEFKNEKLCLFCYGYCNPVSVLSLPCCIRTACFFFSLLHVKLIAIFVGIYTLEFDAFLGWNIVLFLFESHSHAIISYNSTNPFVWLG